MPLSSEALWGVSPLWASMPLCAVGVALAEAEALGVGAEVVAPEVGWLSFGEHALTPKTRADRAVTARRRRVVIMDPSYENARDKRPATPLVTE